MAQNYKERMVHETSKRYKRPVQNMRGNRETMQDDGKQQDWKDGDAGNPPAASAEGMSVSKMAQKAAPSKPKAQVSR